MERLERVEDLLTAAAGAPLSGSPNSSSRRPTVGVPPSAGALIRSPRPPCPYSTRISLLARPRRPSTATTICNRYSLGGVLSNASTSKRGVQVC